MSRGRRHGRNIREVKVSAPWCMGRSMEDKGMIVHVYTTGDMITAQILKGVMMRFRSGEFDPNTPYELDDRDEPGGLGLFRFECKQY